MDKLHECVHAVDVGLRAPEAKKTVAAVTRLCFANAMVRPLRALLPSFGFPCLQGLRSPRSPSENFFVCSLVSVFQGASVCTRGKQVPGL